MKLHVYTETGAVHEYDDEQLTYTRLVPSGELRRDGEQMHVIVADPPVIGKSWVLLLQLRDDDVPTVRTTSPVVRVEEVPE